MNGLAERHRRIADVVEPLEQMGVEATVNGRNTEGDELFLSLDLWIPPTLEAVDVGGDAVEQVAALQAECERLRRERDELKDEVGRLEAELETVQSRLRVGEGMREEGRDARHEEQRNERRDETGSSAEKRNRDTPNEGDGTTNEGDLTDGERETLDALRAMGGFQGSGEISDEVDATLQSVQSWLPKLVQTGHIRTRPDPTDGRRKLYAAAEPEEDTESEDRGDVSGTVYIASAGGSPSQVFHVREDCPQLQKSTDCVEKDRSVVPHHRPCSNCVPGGLEEGLVAIAKGSSSTTYHKREDCPKLGSATNVTIQKRETVPNHDPCDDCVHRSGEQSSDERGAESSDERGAESSDEHGEQSSDGQGEESSNANVGQTEDEQAPNEESEERPDVEEEPDGAAARETKHSDPMQSSGGDHSGDDGGEEPAGGHDPDGREGTGHEDGPTAADICGRNDLDREEVVDALESATAIYHVQRDLTLPSGETEALLRCLGLFEDLHGGGHVSHDDATLAVREHVPSMHVNSNNGEDRN